MKIAIKGEVEEEKPQREYTNIMFLFLLYAGNPALNCRGNGFYEQFEKDFPVSSRHL